MKLDFCFTGKIIECVKASGNPQKKGLDIFLYIEEKLGQLSVYYFQLEINSERINPGSRPVL